MDAATIITQTIAQSGTDASRATVLSLLQEAYKTQVVRSRWLMEQTSIGPTVAGQSDYALPDGVVEVDGLKVGSFQFDAIGAKAMWDQTATSGGSWNGRYGLYAPTYSSGGGVSITLYPTPDTSGTAITVRAPALAADLTDSGGSVPVTPTDTHGSLIDGTTALILLRIDERPDLAVPFQQRFDGATEEIRRRRNARVGSGGGVQMQVAGIHFSG